MQLDWIEYEQRSVALLKAMEEQAHNDFDAMFLAYATIDVNNVQSSRTLRDLLKRHPTWILPRAVLASKSALEPIQTRNIVRVKELLQELESLQRLYPNNHFLEFCQFEVLLQAVETGERTSYAPYLELKPKATEIAYKLAGYPPALRMLAHYYDIIGDRTKAIGTWHDAMKQGSATVAFDAIGFFYREGLLDEGLQMINNSDQTRPEMRAAKAYLPADRPDGALEALALFEALTSDTAHDTWWVRQMASKIPLLLGDSDKAKDIARAWIRTADELDAQATETDSTNGALSTWLVA